MNLSFFDQFSSPFLLGIPLILISITFPALLLPPLDNSKLLTNSQPFTLILTSLIIFLLLINLLGLLPYTFTPTTQLSINLAPAFPLSLGTAAMGLAGSALSCAGGLSQMQCFRWGLQELFTVGFHSIMVIPANLGMRIKASSAPSLQLFSFILSNYMIMIFYYFEHSYDFCFGFKQTHGWKFSFKCKVKIHCKLPAWD
uniref:ATP synthase F(0) complex subunit a n=1 Tax=Zonotrichia albicollis TaxID=44394 RepID=A0A8D2MQD2_ZONAL